MLWGPYLVLIISLVRTAAVEFTYAGVLECAGERIDVGSYAAPVMADWNGDGLPDLICGQFDHGRIRYYPNEGAPGYPLFGEFHFLMDGEDTLSVPYG